MELQAYILTLQATYSWLGDIADSRPIHKHDGSSRTVVYNSSGLRHTYSLRPTCIVSREKLNPVVLASV